MRTCPFKDTWLVTVIVLALNNEYLVSMYAFKKHFYFVVSNAFFKWVKVLVCVYETLNV